MRKTLTRNIGTRRFTMIRAIDRERAWNLWLPDAERPGIPGLVEMSVTDLKRLRDMIDTAIRNTPKR